MSYRLCCKVTESSVKLFTLNPDIRNIPQVLVSQFSDSKMWKLGN